MVEAKRSAAKRGGRRRIIQGPKKPFVVQLVDVQVHEIQTKRRRHHRDDGDQPQVDAWLTPLDASENLPAFAVIAGADVTYPIDAKNTAVVRLSVLGLFSAGEAVAPELLIRFQSHDALVLLWPYVRGHVGSVTKMLNLPIAPLPTLDVQEMIQHAAHSHGENA